MPQHGYPINWNTPAGSDLLKHPYYIKYSSIGISAIQLANVQTDLGKVLANREGAEVINYLSWLIRTIQLQTVLPP